MKPLVLASYEDETGDRCVDIICFPEGDFAFRECRRDPEDSHGWRHLAGGEPQRYETEQAALAAAKEAVLWLI